MKNKRLMEKDLLIKTPGKNPDKCEFDYTDTDLFKEIKGKVEKICHFFELSDMYGETGTDTHWLNIRYFKQRKRNCDYSILVYGKYSVSCLQNIQIAVDAMLFIDYGYMQITNMKSTLRNYN